MRAIAVDDGAADAIALLARAWNISEGAVVGRLLDAFRQQDRDDDRPVDNGLVPIYALYEGQRIEAIYDPSTRAVQVSSGPLAGRSFKSPSGAACAVVQALKPHVHPNRNGWGFWLIVGAGKTLQSIRRMALVG